MTEEELRLHIQSMAERPGRGVQPPFADVAFALHPSEPVDYEQIRARACEKILGPCDGVYHPAVGAPHIDFYRYPPIAGRPFWCYVTNGMSDFPQLHADGSSFRSEVMCASSSEWVVAAELAEVLGTMPFRDDTFLHWYHTVPFPDGVGDPRYTYIMMIPPFLVAKMTDMSFLGQPLVMMAVIRITAEERRVAVERSSQFVVDSLPDELDTWLLDGRLGSRT